MHCWVHRRPIIERWTLLHVKEDGKRESTPNLHHEAPKTNWVLKPLVTMKALSHLQPSSLCNVGAFACTDSRC